MAQGWKEKEEKLFPADSLYLLEHVVLYCHKP